MRYAVPVLWVALVLLPLAFGGSLDSFGMVMIGLAIVWVAGMPSYLRWTVRRKVARYYQQGLVNGHIGPHRIELMDTGLRDSTPVSEWHMAWAGVDRVAEAPGHLFVYVGPHSAHIIPKTALGDRLSFFREIIEHKSARQGRTLQLTR